MSEPHPIQVEKRKSFCGPPIQVHVNSHNFYVHESVLRRTSGFFEAMLNKDWKEATTRVVNLPEDKPDDVLVYVDWLYTQQLAMKFPDTTDHDQCLEARGVELRQLARLYCFGEKIQDKEFCNTVIGAITETLDTRINGNFYCFNTLFVSTIYAGTPPGSPIRRLLLEVYAEQSDASWFDGSKGCVPECSEFLKELALEFVTSRGKSVQDSRKTWFERREEWFKKE